MGCGASVPAGAPSEPTESEKLAARQEVVNSSPAPIAEDVQVVQVQEQKKQFHCQGGQGEGEAGAPDPPAPRRSQSERSSAEGPSTEKPEAPQPVEYACEPSPPPTLAAPNAADQEAPEQVEPSQAHAFAPEPHPGNEPTGEAADEVTQLVLVESSDADLDRELEQTPSRQAQPTTTALDPAVTPSSQTATVTLLPEASALMLRSRYTNESDLSFASASFNLSGRLDDSDDDELDALFTLHAWKRFYGYNKNKHQDLLTYFWRKFSPKDYSCFCVSYRDQDLLVTSYMAENCVNGFCARIEDMGLADSLFLQMYVLHDFKADQFRIVGLLLVQGQSLPPQLGALSAFDGFVYHKADTSVTLIKQFVSALLVGRSPLNSLQLLSGREVL